MTDADTAAAPLPKTRRIRRRMLPRRHTIVTAFRPYAYDGQAMSFRQLAQLFDLPKTTTRRMV